MRARTVPLLVGAIAAGLVAILAGSTGEEGLRRAASVRDAAADAGEPEGPRPETVAPAAVAAAPPDDAQALLAEVRRRLADAEREGGNTVVLPGETAALMRRVDLREVEPPRQYRGTELGWRLQGRIEIGELADLLGRIAELEPRDRQSVLTRTRLDADPRLAPAPVDPRLVAALVQARRGVDGPQLLLQFAATARAVCRSTAETPEGAELLEACLDALARMATRFRPHLQEPQWSAIHQVLIELRKDVPGFERLPRIQPLMDAIREGARETLREAVRPEPNYMGGLGTIRLGILLADEGLRDVLLDLLRARDIVNGKIARADSRTDLALLEMISGEIRREGSPRQRMELAEILTDALLDGRGDPKTRETLIQQGRLLRKSAAGDEATAFPALEAALDRVALPR